MRLLLTTDTIGGVWTFTKELCEALLGCGEHAVALVAIGGHAKPFQLAWVTAMQAAYRDRFVFVSMDAPLEWMEDNTCAYADVAAKLLRLALSFRVDVVHASQFCFGALDLSVPKVVTAHSDVLSWAEACRPAGLEESAWLTRYRRLVEEGLAGADAIVAPTAWMARAMERHYCEAGSVQVIANGRTIPSVGRPVRRLQAVAVGRWWDEGKGLPVLARAGWAMPVLVAGEGIFDAETAPRPAGVSWLGGLDEEAVLRLFAQSSVYLATSIYEPFGLAPLEAALAGCAVVANKIAPLQEVWGDAATYFTGETELRKILSDFAEQPGLLRKAQARSKARAGELSAEKMVAGYLALYGELMEGRATNVLEECAAYAV